MRGCALRKVVRNLAHKVLRRLPWPRRFLAKAIRGPEPGAHVLEPLHLTPYLGATTGRLSTFSSVFLCLFLSFCLYSLEVTVTSLHPPRLCRVAVFSIKPTFLSLKAQSANHHQRGISAAAVSHKHHHQLSAAVVSQRMCGGRIPFLSLES